MHGVREYYVPVIDVYLKQLSQLLQVGGEIQSTSFASKRRENTIYAKLQSATWGGADGHQGSHSIAQMGLELTV